MNKELIQQKNEIESRSRIEIQKKAALEEKIKKQKEQYKLEKELSKVKASEKRAAKEQNEKYNQKLIFDYILEYQTRVGNNWIKDPCRGIYNLPRAITKDGIFIKLTGTSGSYRCDQSLINAIKTTTTPKISNSTLRKKIETENINFIFKQN